MKLSEDVFCLTLNPVSSNKVGKHIPTCCNCLVLSPRSVKEMNEILLLDIVMDKNNFDLKDNSGALVNEDAIYVIGMGGVGNENLGSLLSR